MKIASHKLLSVNRQLRKKFKVMKKGPEFFPGIFFVTHFFREICWLLIFFPSNVSGRGITLVAANLTN